ncbi:MAG TPA: hypothetical protein VFB97_02500 [Bacteroidales bacterium]|nr:hypothetical protein [Bacteroidales bacterium]
MKKAFVFLFLVFLGFSCRKESSSFLWEKSFGPGNAYYISSSPDSGIVACGKVSGSPFLLKLSKEKISLMEYTSGRDGLFDRAWYDTSVFIAAGSSNGDMLLAAINKNGRKLWDTIISAGFNIDFTRLCYSGSGSFIAVGTASADSSGFGTTGLLFLQFDTTGLVLGRKDVTSTGLISAGDPVLDASGNLYIPVTRKNAGLKTKASLLKYNVDLNQLWATDLYNNIGFSSSANGAISDDAGNIYICGKTEVSGTSGTLENSFAASLSSTGSIIWKKYLEDSNSGSAMLINNSDILMTLSRDCFIIDKTRYDEVKDSVASEGIIRWFSACDPYNTDAFGSGFDIDPEGNIIAAGSMAGKFYLAVKSSSQ